MIARMRSSPWRLQATADGTRVRVSWLPPDSGPAPDEYRLEVGSARGASNILALNTASRSTILDAMGPPGTYYMRVRAIRAGVPSSASNEVRLEIAAGASPPNAPTVLTAATSGRRFTFNWLAPSGGPQPTGYVIEAGSQPGLSNLASLRLGTATTFSISGVPPGSYYVRVRAENAGGASGATNEVLVTTTTGQEHCTPVEQPGPIAYRLAGPQLTLEWEAHATGAAPSGYRLEAGTAPGLANLAILTLGTARTFAVGAPPGTYYLRLRAFNACGTSVPGPTIRLVVP
jgi:predicted phage tail protein